MKAYLVAVAYHDDLTNSPHATAAIIISETNDRSALLQLPILENVGLYELQVVALANHAKERGLI